MPIISTIGRKNVKVRVLILTIYVLLFAGALTMIYPFLLMLAGTTKSAVDTPEAKIIPSFLVNETDFYRKDIEAFVNEDLEIYQMAYHSFDPSFRKIVLPKNQNRKLIQEWKEFLKSKDLPYYFYQAAYISVSSSGSTLPMNIRKFKAGLFDEYNGNVQKLNQAMGTEFSNWFQFIVRPEEYMTRLFQPGYSPFNLAYRKFKESLPHEYRIYFSPSGYFVTTYLKNQYTRNLKEYNSKHKTNYKSWNEVKFSRRYPKHLTVQERKDWEVFVRQLISLFWVRVDDNATPIYRKMLKAKYKTITALNKTYGTNYKSFNNIPLIKEPPKEGKILSDWYTFIYQGWEVPGTKKVIRAPIESIYIHSIDFMFQDYLKNKYKTVAQANTALGSEFKKWNDVIPPQQGAHYEFFRSHQGMLRWEYIKRNYIAVADYILLHGRGVLNTAIYCFLAILSALIVNPLAAYALSRYKPPSQYKVLLFLMLTMAFPPMVTQIPVFLMLREFNLLNTFWALILPGMANGYNIFLLKGFFDSLPQELYESAELDGAGEIRIFWQITMNLSKPILAVIALQAFTLAYSNFMMALLICQDERMWTLMPWLYQLQQRSCQGVVFTSLIIAAIPTFVVFALCQNVIMRGIVVPVEK